MENKLNEILENAPGNKYDVYYVLCNECIANSDEPDKTLMQILTYSKNIGAEDSSEPTNMSTEDIKDVEEKYNDLINEIVQVIIKDNPSEEEFYKTLYENIFISKLLPQNSKAKAVIVKILRENVRFIPYYQAKELLKMTNDDYAEFVEKIKPYAMKAIHMLNRNFDTLTEIASQLYEIENSIENREDKIVFISAVLGLMMQKREQVDIVDDEN